MELVWPQHHPHRLHNGQAQLAWSGGFQGRSWEGAGWEVHEDELRANGRVLVNDIYSNRLGTNTIPLSLALILLTGNR